MTQEEKELLLIDLCARLPYHTIVSTGEEDLELVKVDILNGLVYVFSESFLEFDASKIKPYLRPRSEIAKLISAKEFTQLSGIDLIDWYNTNHIDYRGLIPMGLALEAPEGMYN
jgi:hypothetical protein